MRSVHGMSARTKESVWDVKGKERKMQESGDLEQIVQLGSVALAEAQQHFDEPALDGLAVQLLQCLFCRFGQIGQRTH